MPPTPGSTQPNERDERDAPASLASYPWVWRAATTVELLAATACWLAAVPPYTWIHAAQAQLVEFPVPVLSAVALFSALFLPTCIAYALLTGPRRRELGMSLDQAARLHELAPWGGRQRGSALARRLPPGLILAALVLTGAGVSMGPAPDADTAQALTAQRTLLLGAGGVCAALSLLVTLWRTWRDRPSDSPTATDQA